MRKRLLFLSLYVGIVASLDAQILDSVRMSLTRRSSITGGFSTKQTFISGFKSPIFTARIGVDFDNRIRIGGGISFLKATTYDSSISQSPFIYKKEIADTAGKRLIPSHLRFTYLSYYVEYVFYKSKHWEFSIPFWFGIGNTYYEYDYQGLKIAEYHKPVLLYEPVISGQYKIFWWLGVGMDIGYRIMIVNNKAIGSNFNSPVYNFGGIIYFGSIYRKVKNKIWKKKT